MSENSSRNHGKEIGEIVRGALQSGDLSRLKDLGPAVQDVVKDATKNIPNITMETREDGNVPATRGEHRPGRTNPAGTSQPRPYWQGGAPRKSGGIPPGILRIIFGILGMVAFGLCALIFAGVSLAGMLSGVFWPLSAVFGAGFLGCAGLTASGFGKNKLAKRMNEYYALFEKKPVYTYPELAAELGREPKQIRREIKKAQKKGLLKDIRTDAADTCLIRGDEAYKLYLESEKSREEREREEAERQRRLEDPATAGIEVFRSEGVATLRKIRAANEAIPGEEISDKLERLETTTARIFSYVEAHPEKLPDTRKFMSYYLPTTLKLVEKYQQYEEMDYQPENVKQAKRDIENTLDTIDDAFKNLLESLFDHDTLDVSTDIDVLQQMLEQEGLTGKRFEIDEPDGSIHLTNGM